MFCENCGSKLDVASKFCGGCGKRLRGRENITIEFDLKCQILAGVWLKNTELSDREFLENNDVGLSLAFAYVHELILGLSERGIDFVELSFDSLLENYGLSEKEIVYNGAQATINSIN